eukprot:8172895-Prorocentrum_lima.AAC.1
MGDYGRRLEALEADRADQAPGGGGGARSAPEGRNERSVDHETLVVVGGFPEDTRSLRMKEKLTSLTQD